MPSRNAKCRKCRATIINGQYLLTLAESVEGIEGPQAHECQRNVWFICDEVIPDSILSVIEQSGYTKGKILCPQCGSKLGGFDFVSGTKCECARVVLPPVWLSKNKVDNTMALPTHIEVRLREYQQAPRVPSIDDLPEPNHDDHMFDTECHRCRHEFLMSERNYEFRGPVSHGDHVFDTSCDICRAVFLAEHIENEFEFQVESELPIEPAQETEEIQSEEDHSKQDAPQGETATEVTATVSTPPETQAEGEQPDNNVCATEALAERGGGDADDEPKEDSEWEKPSNEVVLEPVPEPEQEENKEEDAAVAKEEPESLLCPVCLELLYLPHWCKPCEHVFCAPCLRRLRAISPAANTRCPLCRNVIVKCLPQHELSRSIKSLYPEEHRKRRVLEKRSRRQPQQPLPGAPVPGTLSSFLAQRANRNRGGGGGSQVLAAGAGVCFVVLLMMLGFTVFATTIGFLLWYLVEVSMDILCDLAMEVSTFFELTYQALVLMCIEGRVPTDLAHLMSASAGRMLHSFTKLVNRTKSAASEDVPEVAAEAVNGTATSTQFLTRMAQAQMANYVLVGFLVTYLLYRFAKHVQQVRRVEA